MSASFPGQSFTIPNVCSHGTGWSLPCAACNRPTPPQPIAPFDVALHRKLDHIIVLLERAAQPVPLRDLDWMIADGCRVERGALRPESASDGLREALEIIGAPPVAAPDAIGVTARNIARAALREGREPHDRQMLDSLLAHPGGDWCELTPGCLMPKHEQGEPPCITEGPHGERRAVAAALVPDSLDVAGLRAATRAAFAGIWRSYVASPEEGADDTDAAIASALRAAEEAVQNALAAALREGRKP